jgi:hypothetical protein
MLFVLKLGNDVFNLLIDFFNLLLDPLLFLLLCELCLGSFIQTVDLIFKEMYALFTVSDGIEHLKILSLDAFKVLHDNVSLL